MSDNKREPSSISDGAPVAKRPRENDKEILDLAKSLGFKDGDRLEVAWHVNDEENVHWWGATLLPWNSEDIVDECVAVRHLKYDSHPDAGFDEESIEPVVFLGVNCLAHPETQEELNFRREGEEEEVPDETPTVAVSDPSEVVEQTLQNALSKFDGVLSMLPASQQAQIAAKVAEKREQLVDHLTATQGVVTEDRMQDILARVWRGEKPEATST